MTKKYYKAREKTQSHIIGQLINKINAAARENADLMEKIYSLEDELRTRPRMDLRLKKVSVELIRIANSLQHLPTKEGKNDVSPKNQEI